MKAKITLSVICVHFFFLFIEVAPATAQGCALTNKTIPAQYLVFEKLLEPSEKDRERSSNKAQSRGRIVLRLLNNTNCDILVRSYEAPDTRRLETTKLPNGELRITSDESGELSDGGWLTGLAYSVEYREPLPPPRKRFYQVNDVMPPQYRLQAGRSVLFSVPLSLFDKWINLNVSFDYAWDQNTSEAKYWRSPSHEIFFENEDLPEEVLRRTKSCRRTNGCNPTLPRAP